MKYCMVLTTCDKEETARTLGAGLVEKKLAACVQIHQVTSIYPWKDKIHTDPEFRLIIKTRDALYPAVEDFITARHGYDVPQVVKIPIETGLRSYLGWMEENTRP